MLNHSFLYFCREAFPCQFLIEVEEGFARMKVENQDSLEKLLAYCRTKSYEVSWSKALLEEEETRKLLAEYPGGQYVACVRSLEERTEGAHEPVSIQS